MHKCRSVVLPDALAEEVAAFARSKHRGYQDMALEALALGLRMLQMRSDQAVQVVRRREDNARP